MVQEHAEKTEANQSPVWGCVLIGGRSTRMGRPKHLLERNGITWLELIIRTLEERTEKVVISGNGFIPESLGDYPVIRDIDGMEGPLAGILAVLRSHPGVSWLVAACDMPEITVEALDWLLNQRDADTLAVLPDLGGNGQVEPLLAYYDRNCLDLLEETVSSGSRRPGSLAGKSGVKTPVPPASLHQAWKNINYPGELKV